MKISFSRGIVFLNFPKISPAIFLIRSYSSASSLHLLRTLLAYGFKCAYSDFLRYCVGLFSTLLFFILAVELVLSESVVLFSACICVVWGPCQEPDVMPSSTTHQLARRQGSAESSGNLSVWATWQGAGMGSESCPIKMLGTYLSKWQS